MCLCANVISACFQTLELWSYRAALWEKYCCWMLNLTWRLNINMSLVTSVPTQAEFELLRQLRKGQSCFPSSFSDFVFSEMAFGFLPLCLKSELFWVVFGFWWSVRLLGRTSGGCGGLLSGDTHTAASRYLLMFIDAIFRLEDRLKAVMCESCS